MREVESTCRFLSFWCLSLPGRWLPWWYLSTKNALWEIPPSLKNDLTMALIAVIAQPRDRWCPPPQRSRIPAFPSPWSLLTFIMLIIIAISLKASEIGILIVLKGNIQFKARVMWLNLREFYHKINLLGKRWSIPKKGTSRSVLKIWATTKLQKIWSGLSFSWNWISNTPNLPSKWWKNANANR